MKNTEKAQNLMDGIFIQMNRVREIIPLYEQLPNGVGAFGLAVIRQALARAEASIKNNDVVEMLVAYQELKQIEG